MPFQQVLDEFPVRFRDLGTKLGFGCLRVPAHHDLGNQQVDAEGLAIDPFVDPVELDIQFLRGESDRAEDTEAAGIGHLGDHIAAVRKGEQREFDPQPVAESRVHHWGVPSFCSADRPPRTSAHLRFPVSVRCFPFPIQISRRGRGRRYFSPDDR
ncbi:MAG: hypothetical protein J0H19_11935 [Rhodospirillales bacterium]|nr:hypothetical protein [Rhodospirillales bacterium]